MSLFSREITSCKSNRSRHITVRVITLILVLQHLFYIKTVMLSQLNKDIDYCTRVLGCNAEQTDELIGAAEALTVNAEYFCEEFIVAPEGENAMKYQREDFIDLDAFNAYHGIYFEEVE